MPDALEIVEAAVLRPEVVDGDARVGHALEQGFVHVPGAERIEDDADADPAWARWHIVRAKASATSPCQ